MDTEAPEDETPEERAERERYEVRTDPDKDLCFAPVPNVYGPKGVPFFCCKSGYHKSPHSAIVGTVKTYSGSRPLRLRWPGTGPRAGARFPDALDFRRRGERE